MRFGLPKKMPELLMAGEPSMKTAARLFRPFRKNRLLVFSCVVVFIVFLPVILPVGIGMYLFDRRKMRQVIFKSRCPNCGIWLDTECMERGDTRWQTMMKGCFGNDLLLLRMRIVRDLHAICHACGGELTYVEGSRTLKVRAEGQ